METLEGKNFNVRLELRVKNAELVAARESLNLNQKQAAELIEISQTTLGSYELLKNYPPRKTQEKICNAYRKAGIFLLEEDVFPEELKGVKLEGKLIAEKEIPVEKLIPLSSLNERLLPEIQPNAVKIIFNNEMKEEIQKILFRLDENKRKVVMMHYGIDQNKEYSLREIGRELGISRSRAGQILKQALKYFKKAYVKKNLADFY